jgi:outer membrane protein OmpA-like peptidoglycan-associated protein
MSACRPRTWILLAALVALSGCAVRTTPETRRTGASAGESVAHGAIPGLAELDVLLASPAIGPGLGAGLGAYVDRCEDKLARVPGASIERIAEDTILVHFDADLLFEVGAATLGPDARTSLDQAAAVFVGQPQTAILAQGHTDASGDSQLNLALSEQRAGAVRSYLVQHGVDADRILALGYGEGHARRDNDSASGRRLNRRVDLLLKAKRR